jgi:hypothetical protein
MLADHVVVSVACTEDGNVYLIFTQQPVTDAVLHV